MAVIINEYIEITKAFYDGNESGFINGVLQETAQKLRAKEVLEHKNERAKSSCPGGGSRIGTTAR